MSTRPQRERSRAIISDLKNINGKRTQEPGHGPVIGGSTSARAAVATVFANATNKRTRVEPTGDDAKKDKFAMPKQPTKGKSRAVKSPVKRIAVEKTINAADFAPTWEGGSPRTERAKAAKDPEKSMPMAKQQRDEAKRKKEQLKQETAQWRSKYRGAIKTFTFFFDRVDPVTEMQLTKEVEQWGARVDQFFSKAVTHVITSRSMPSHQSPTKATKAVPSPIKRVSPYKLPVMSPPKENINTAGPVRRGKGGASAVTAKSRVSPRVEVADKSLYVVEQQAPAADALLLKALEFKIKVWKIEKLQNVLSRLVDDRLIKPAPAPKPSLPSLLRDEARQGHTLERDITVPRSDFHYFSSKIFFFLVEDSTGQHRPIHVREFEATNDFANAEWPIIRKGMEGKTAMAYCRPQDSYRTVQDRIERMFAIRREEELARQRKAGRKFFELGGGFDAKDPEQENKPCGDDSVPVPTGKVLGNGAAMPLKSKSLLPAAHIGNPPHLRRSASMNILQQRQSKRLAAHKPREDVAPTEDDEDKDHLVNATAQEHHRGPGDVFLAASGNSVSLTSNIASATSTALGPPSMQSRGFPDHRLAELNRKGITMARPGSALANGAGTTREVKPLPARLRAVQDQSPRLKRSQSVDGALLERKRKEQGKKEAKGYSRRTRLLAALTAVDMDELKKEDAKPGYCENCRIKYDDFKDHTQSRRHRKFARNDDNWWQLDDLLTRTTRVVRPGVTLPNHLRPKITKGTYMRVYACGCGNCPGCGYHGAPEEQGEDEDEDDLQEDEGSENEEEDEEEDAEEEEEEGGEEEGEEDGEEEDEE